VSAKSRTPQQIDAAISNRRLRVKRAFLVFPRRPQELSNVDNVSGVLCNRICCTKVGSGCNKYPRSFATSAQSLMSEHKVFTGLSVCGEAILPGEGEVDTVHCSSHF
jgi:hypothetical protein